VARYELENAKAFLDEARAKGFMRRYDDS